MLCVCTLLCKFAASAPTDFNSTVLKACVCSLNDVLIVSYAVVLTLVSDAHGCALLHRVACVPCVTGANFVRMYTTVWPYRTLHVTSLNWYYTAS
jgi:hypothetical protein